MGTVSQARPSLLRPDLTYLLREDGFEVPASLLVVLLDDLDEPTADEEEALVRSRGEDRRPVRK